MTALKDGVLILEDVQFSEEDLKQYLSSIRIEEINAVSSLTTTIPNYNPNNSYIFIKDNNLVNGVAINEGAVTFPSYGNYKIIEAVGIEVLNIGLTDTDSYCLPITFEKIYNSNYIDAPSFEKIYNSNYVELTAFEKTYDKNYTLLTTFTREDLNKNYLNSVSIEKDYDSQFVDSINISVEDSNQYMSKLNLTIEEIS